MAPSHSQQGTRDQVRPQHHKLLKFHLGRGLRSIGLSGTGVGADEDEDAQKKAETEAHNFGAPFLVGCPCPLQRYTESGLDLILLGIGVLLPRPPSRIDPTWDDLYITEVYGANEKFPYLRIYSN